MTEEERRHVTNTSASLAGKTIFMSGGSCGIGLAIARRAARDGANFALLAKSAEPQPKLTGTIYTAAEEIEGADGRALPILGDVRDVDAVRVAVRQAADEFPGDDELRTDDDGLQLEVEICHPPVRVSEVVSGMQNFVSGERPDPPRPRDPVTW